jgi:hypothetical protein
MSLHSLLTVLLLIPDSPIACTRSLRDREIDLARHAEHAYERFVQHWQPRRRTGRTGAANEERR